MATRETPLAAQRIEFERMDFSDAMNRATYNLWTEKMTSGSALLGSSFLNRWMDHKCADPKKCNAHFSLDGCFKNWGER